MPSGTTDECFERIKTLADLVVRIRVQKTSLARPENDSLAEYRGSGRLRLGTGVISYLSQSKSGEICPCLACDGNVARKHWKFTVHTARHVVYDTQEAKASKVDLFYDDQSSRRDGRMQTVRAVEMQYAASDTDKCIVLCVTHDETLAQNIKCVDQSWQSFCHHHPILNQNVRENAFRILRELSEGGPVFVVVISHPHGQPKKVTVGKIVSGAEDSSFNYTTATCPGSSGAPLFLVDSELFTPGFFPWFGYVHSGTFPEPSHKTRKHINFSNCFVYN
ncbi:hypothetical protein ElyMa_002666500 [Elysia marginata]|uniref:Peptidase S1 domain-containing protein n=1 Tax=Elysia marginata TaxID=1093978 RepID=A0AAV4HAB1_9GAST|nr:hypothetical protein ElyMa_002666500 [Elysia marginata]